MAPRLIQPRDTSLGAQPKISNRYLQEFSPPEFSIPVFIQYSFLIVYPNHLSVSGLCIDLQHNWSNHFLNDSAYDTYKAWVESNLQRPVDQIIAAMEKVQDSKFARIVDKLAVSSEPGLSNAQLMLTNEDLKPGEQTPQIGSTPSGG